MYHVVGRRTYNPLYSGCGGSKQAELYDEDGSLPKGGEKVESVKYFTRYLAILNDRVARMQAEKQGLASKGDHSIRASQWISHALGLASDAAVTTLVSALEVALNTAQWVSNMLPESRLGVKEETMILFSTLGGETVSVVP
jgi:hypothetical protein